MKLSRRTFLKASAFVSSNLLIGSAFWRYRGSVQRDSLAQIPDLMPAARSETLGPRVIHTISAAATDWDFGTDWFGDHVDQVTMDQMTDEGLRQLTNTTSRAEAWLTLLPNYQSGQQVAIKVNFNNCLGDGPCGNAINALIEPVNALIQGLIERGVAATNIWVFDVTHAWHDGRMDPRFIAGCDFPGVHFVAYVGESNPYSSTEFIHFNTPPGGPSINDLPLCNVLVNADYLINMPIVKVHPFTGVTLGFKNHFGSFDRCDYAHTYTPGCPADQHPCYYDPNYSPLIDIYSNPHIGDKTILTVGECLFGAWSDPIWIPLPWSTFGNGAPNSLFFASDPVAIECVMTDILEAETALLPQTDDYLRLAGQAGLGIYERGNPWGAGYEQIDYIRISLTPTAVDLARFEATAQPGAVGLEWETATELENLGFNLYRAEAADGARVQLNGELIPAQHPGSVGGATYTFLDRTVEANSTYYYWLEDMDAHGMTKLHGPATATVPLGWRLRPTRPRPALQPVPKDLQ